jgi:UPF0176 protein
MSFVNISAYKFISLIETDLPELQEKFLKVCKELDFKGTILLSPEGINVLLSGTQENIECWANYFAQDPRFADMVFKKSVSELRPFRRLQVKIKNEIIRFDQPQIKPENYTSKHLSPEAFKQWLDEGKEVLVLDTRNDYEVRVGTFNGAVNLKIATFTEFPQAVSEKLNPELKDKPVVMFCTGGVRCEKAGPALEEQGFKEVYQLDGGILKYFEKCGGAHWEGECFVFDDRLAVDANLNVSNQGYCPNCVHPLPEEHRQLPPYLRLKKCAHCESGKRFSKVTE